jgi:tetratricopeptide (TPR) repeat protein
MLWFEAWHCCWRRNRLCLNETLIFGLLCRIVEGRQRAERCRVAGNAAFKAAQWAEAYRCYEEGLDAERSNAKLQGNAAMAALKMGCFAQAIAHCDKVIRLYEFLLKKPDDPLVVKALQRRATARTALGHHKEAVHVRDHCWPSIENSRSAKREA